MLIGPGATAHPGNRRTACGFTVEGRRLPVFPTEGGPDRIRGLPDEGRAASGDDSPRRKTWRQDVVESPETYAKHESESCWTHRYLLRHCEEFRVDLPDRHLGYVEEVVLLPDGSEPIGFLVRGDSSVAFVSVHQIRDFSPRAGRILVDPLPVVRRRAPPRQPPREVR
jgi:hypothetical protein